MTKEQLIEGVGLYCDDHNITVEQFAKIAGIHFERMKLYCNGEYELTDDDALKISLLLRVPWEPSLKSCPFCGGEASIVWNVDPGIGEPRYAIICPECGIGLINVNISEHSSGFFSGKWDAIKAWNRRL